MTCTNAQDTVMLYHEKRIKPLKSLALHQHIHKCEDCREFFLAMEDALTIEPFSVEIPEGFVDKVMSKVVLLPTPMRLKSPLYIAKIDWVRLAGSLYALVLAAVLAVLYNTELVQIPYPTLGVGDWAGAFFGGIAQAGHSVVVNTATIAGNIGNFILAIAVVLGLALTFMVMKEKSNSQARATYE